MKNDTHKSPLGNFTDLLIALGRDAANQKKSGALLLTYGLLIAPTLSAAVGEQSADDDEDTGSGTSTVSRDLTPKKRRRRVRV